MVLISQSSFQDHQQEYTWEVGEEKDTEEEKFSLFLMLPREWNKYLDTKMVLWSYALRAQIEILNFQWKEKNIFTT